MSGGLFSAVRLDDCFARVWARARSEWQARAASRSSDLEWRTGVSSWSRLAAVASRSGDEGQVASWTCELEGRTGLANWSGELASRAGVAKLEWRAGMATWRSALEWRIKHKRFSSFGLDSWTLSCVGFGLVVRLSHACGRMRGASGAVRVDYCSARVRAGAWS